MKEGVNVPNVTFKTRVRDEAVGGDNPFRWQDVTSQDIFNGKRVVIFSLPGAFTPTCSTYQLPGFEENYDTIRNLDVDEVYVVSVNDSFVMNAWYEYLGLGFKTIPLPDGNGMFTGLLNQLVLKENLGFGYRSWRYAMVVNNGIIEAFWEEPGKEDNCEEDPYGETHPDKVLEYLLKSAEGGILNQKGESNNE